MDLLYSKWSIYIQYYYQRTLKNLNFEQTQLPSTSNKGKCIGWELIHSTWKIIYGSH